MAEQRANQLNVYIYLPQLPFLLPTITPIPLGPAMDNVLIAAGMSCIAYHHVRPGRALGTLFNDLGFGAFWPFTEGSRIGKYRNSHRNSPVSPISEGVWGPISFPRGTSRKSEGTTARVLRLAADRRSTIVGAWWAVTQPQPPPA